MTITVKHGDFGPHIHGRITRIAVNENGNRVLGQRYFCGYSKPNYPMPAIRYEVEIQNDRIILWTKRGYSYFWDLKYLA